MATSLKLTFKNVYEKVGEFLGIPSLTDTDDITRCKEIALRGYRRFLMPIDLSQNPPRTYRWKFLEKTTTLSTESGTDTYNLPVGFSAIVNPFTHTTPVSFNPTMKPLDFIYKMKSESTGSGYPRYYAIKIGEYDEVKGQQDQVMFYPTPAGTYTYYYTYLITPPAPVNDDDLFIGDIYSSECILEHALAAAEIEKDDVAGVHSQTAETLVQAAIGEDKRNYLVPNLGQMTDGKTNLYYRRYATIYDSEGTLVLPT